MKRFAGSVLVVLACSGWAVGQGPETSVTRPPSPYHVQVLPTIKVLPPASAATAQPAPAQPATAPGDTASPVAFPDGAPTFQAFALPAGCDVCGAPVPRCWASAEWLVWWVEDAPVPPLATTSGAPNDPRRGAIDLPSTTILFGGHDVVFDELSGGRFTVGSWLDDQRLFGVEVSGFVLERETSGFTSGSLQPGSPLLFIPAYRAELGVEGSLIVSDPTFPAQGVLDIDLDTQLWGIEANALRNFARGNGFYLDGLAGFRYLNLNENLSLNALIVGEPTFTVAVGDRFEGDNQFYGGQFGARAGVRRGKMGLEFTGKLALGNTHQVVRVSGVTAQAGTFAAANGQLGVFPGGVFAQPTNIGRRSDDAFTLVPEVQVKLSYDFTPRLSGFFAYNFLYWSDVVRPGDQIDRSVNKTQQGGGTLVGPARPAPRLDDTGFWAQGIGLGLEFRY